MSTILKDKDCIKEAVKGSASITSTIFTKQRQRPIAEMEKMLSVWLEDNHQKHVNVMLSEVQENSNESQHVYKEKYSPSTFSASADESVDDPQPSTSGL